MDIAAAHLLDFSKPFDTALLDQIITIALDSSNPQRQKANDFLVMLKDNPEMWKRVDAILETSKQDSTMFFGLQVLGDAINTRWKIIPQDQRLGIRNYVTGKIIALSATEKLMHSSYMILSRLNLVLVHILKQDWPHAWPSFIGDMVNLSKTSESVCENNMKILKLLSEEVFDFSKDSMTTAKIKRMKESLNEEFSQIFQLCEFILGHSQNVPLILSTLETLQGFLTWIPLGYIFETPIMSVLITKYFATPAFRTVVVDCIAEVAALPPADIPPQYQGVMQEMFVRFVSQLNSQVPPGANFAAAYEEGSEEDCVFFHRLAILLSTYLTNYFMLFSATDGTLLHQDTVMLPSLLYLIRLSEISDEDIFKTCLDYWHHFSKELYQIATGHPIVPTLVGAGGSASSSFGGGGGVLQGGAGSPAVMVRLQVLEPILHLLRTVIIDNMAKPEEVIIVEDENGEIVREMTRDTEVIMQYKTMRDAIVYLTHLNYDDTETIMLQKLELQVTGGEFSWNRLNTLCWAMGSISGAMGEMEEKRFLVSIIKDLLKLCEEQKGKDNKAVVASNIMYIVGQYPRFLRAHWKFLKTVVNKLFEFMHEYHPGVQDMACDTFLKIAQKCKRKFMTPQTEDPEPFILTLINDLQRHTHDLQPHQVLSFYESVGTILSDNSVAIRLSREEVVLRLMDSTNMSWRFLVSEGAKDISTLLTVESINEISKIIKVNIKVCSSAGSIFVHQLSNTFLDTLKIYKLYSEQVKTACAQQGAVAARMMPYKTMRSVKTEIIELFTAFVVASVDLDGGPQSVVCAMLPPLIADVLGDYRTSPTAARDAKVLVLFSTIISTLKEHITSDIPVILDGVFEPTLEMITSNMLDHPDHRIGFFKFLREANEHCFYGLFNIPPQHQKMIVDSIVWAFRHTERNISETGLEILFALLQKIATNPTISQPFYQSFLLTLIQEVMGVMTDRLHKSGFKEQASILMHIFHMVEGGRVTVPLFDPASLPAGSPIPVDNSQFLKEHVATLLITAFPNMTRAHIGAFTLGLFDVSKDENAFKQLLRDFLISVKEFENEDNSDLFIEEAEANLELARMEQRQYRASIPGLLKPDEFDLDDDYDKDA